MNEPEMKISNDPIDHLTINPPVAISESLLDHIVAEVMRALVEVLEKAIEEKLALSSREPQVAPADDFIDKLAGRVKERLGIQD